MKKICFWNVNHVIFLNYKKCNHYFWWFLKVLHIKFTNNFRHIFYHSLCEKVTKIVTTIFCPHECRIELFRSTLTIFEQFFGQHIIKNEKNFLDKMWFLCLNIFYNWTKFLKRTNSLVFRLYLCHKDSRVLSKKFIWILLKIGQICEFFDYFVLKHLFEYWNW